MRKYQAVAKLEGLIDRYKAVRSKLPRELLRASPVAADTAELLFQYASRPVVEPLGAYEVGEAIGMMRSALTLITPHLGVRAEHEIEDIE